MQNYRTNILCNKVHNNIWEIRSETEDRCRSEAPSRFGITSIFPPTRKITLTNQRGGDRMLEIDKSAEQRESDKSYKRRRETGIIIWEQ